MRISAKSFGAFLLAVALGALYAFVVGLTSKPIAAPLIAWPIWSIIFWFAFARFKLLRFTGFIAVLPLTFLAFEILWSFTHPGMNAEVYKTFDRSHYTPGLQLGHAKGGFDADSRSILIAKDGFRGDPETGQGNPKRCRFVLIGDSMIYGSGLPYPLTLGPVLAGMGHRSCVFGVTGNSPIDYLSTLRYVADRIEPGAYVAFYLYAYNDFISLNKYFRRGFLSSNRFNHLVEWSFYLDQRRQATWTYSFLHGQREKPRKTLWEYDIGKGRRIKILYARDPGKYIQPKPFNEGQRLALNLFFNTLDDYSRARSWRIVILIHPDDSEIYANFARRSAIFVGLDPRRAEGLRICKQFSFVCEDMSHYIYERSLAAGENPYFSHDRHFSPFGTQLVAEHFVALTKRIL
jgi:hypothetical protein